MQPAPTSVALGSDARAGVQQRFDHDGAGRLADQQRVGCGLGVEAAMLRQDPQRGHLKLRLLVGRHREEGMAVVGFTAEPLGPVALAEHDDVGHGLGMDERVAPPRALSHLVPHVVHAAAYRRARPQSLAHGGLICTLSGAQALPGPSLVRYNARGCRVTLRWRHCPHWRLSPR